MMAVSIAETTNKSPRQHWFALASVYLHDQLRSVFDVCETALLNDGERSALCCDLRRSRRPFIDNYLNQLWLRCENSSAEWVLGSSGAAARARTLMYLTDADSAVRFLYQEQAARVGRLVAAWQQQTGTTGSVFDCPFAPHAMTRLFFLLLPDIRTPLRVRCQLAQAFVDDLPGFSTVLQDALFTALQRRGVTDAQQPVSMPEWWEPLEKLHQPSVTALALVAPPRTVERVSALAQKIAEAALAEDYASVQALLDSQRLTTLFSWLAERVRDERYLPASGREILCLLAGPLLQAACDESFADHAHPARKVLLEWSHWAIGWQDCLGIEGVVPEFCRELATALAAQLVTQGASLPLSEWQSLLDYLQQLRHRVQQDMSTAVASTRLSLQVLEERAKVEMLLANRMGFDYWPPVVIEILYDYWLNLLLSIHWHEGTTSSSWLSAVAVVDDLLASVQVEQDRQARQHLMQRIPVLLQDLRKGFEQLGCDRKTHSALVDRLQTVHLALMKGDAGSLTESPVRWPAAGQMPKQDQAFDVGTWLRSADGRVMAVEFSDGWCTALRDAHNASLECCSTAALQADFYEGNLEVVIVPEHWLLLSTS